MTQKKPRLLLGILPTPESLRGFFSINRDEFNKKRLRVSIKYKVF
jgi:hypothetical protein